MNRKVIKSILNKKLNQWVASIKDEKVQKLVKANTIVTGGAIANLLMGEEVKDYDLYFKDKATTYAVATYYVAQFNEIHKDRVNKLGGSAKAHVLDGETLRPDGRGGYTFIDNTTEIAKEFSNQSSTKSLMIANTTPDRVKIIVRSDGVAAENKKILNNPFEDAVEAMNDADQLDEKLLETGQEGQKKDPYRPVFLSLWLTRSNW